MLNFFVENKEIIIKLSVAAGLGLLIGLERLLVRREAGMKTHALVSIGSALFIIISELIAVRYSLGGSFDPSRMASQIVVGIGFLGAGSIMRDGSHVTGLTTAGGLWVTAGIGMAAGFGFYGLASIATMLVLLILVFVYIFEKPIRLISNGGDKL